ncbi:MAG: SPOR domain-containing protein [Steroidobacteraceae bacterium]|nr:SPOR domain-containing protein [Steroidobacteraceae bacterium]
MTARDYKKPAPRRRGGGGLSGGAGLAIGLAIGLAVAAGAWFYRPDPPPAAPVAQEAAKPAPLSAQEDAPEQGANGSAVDYTFYDKLKNFEVVIPENEDARPDLKPAPETRPGTYVLQAGSYRQFEDAERVRAQLALQGVESKVQKVTVDADTWHRVRIGPITDLDELNRIRTRLRQAEVDALVIRVGD